MPSRSVVRVRVGGRAPSTDPSGAVVKSPPVGSSPSPTLSNCTGQDGKSPLIKVASALVEKTGVDSHARDASSKFGVKYNYDAQYPNVEARVAKVWSTATNAGQGSGYASTASNAPSKLCGNNATETKLAAASMTKDTGMVVAECKSSAKMPAKHHITGDARSMSGESDPMTTEKANKDDSFETFSGWKNDATQHMPLPKKDDAKRGEDGQRVNSGQDADMQPITGDDSLAATSFETNIEDDIIAPTLPSMDETKECLPHLQNGEGIQTPHSKQDQNIGNEEINSKQNQNITATPNTAPNTQGPAPQYPSWQHYPPQGCFPVPPQHGMMYPPYPPPPYGYMMPPPAPLPPVHLQPAHGQLSNNQTPPPIIEENVSSPQAHSQPVQNKGDGALALLKKNASLALAQQESVPKQSPSNRTPPIIEEKKSHPNSQPQTQRVERTTPLTLPRSEKKKFAVVKDQLYDKARPKSETKGLPLEDNHASAKENDRPSKIPWHMLSSSQLSTASEWNSSPDPPKPKEVEEPKVPWQRLSAKELEESPGKKRKLGSSKIMEML